MGEIIPTHEDLLRKGVHLYCSIYGNQLPDHVGWAPGRINIIGEHTDYNHGFVFPVALPMCTMVIGAGNNTSRINVFTDANVKEERTVSFKTPDMVDLHPGKPEWANYVKGTVDYFQEGIVPGFNAVIVSTIPMKSGLGGSAALEIAIYNFLEELTGSKTESFVKAAICQRAEHDFAHNPCGIMDQFISIFGRKDHGIILDCRDLEYKLIPFPCAPNVTILIINSNTSDHVLTGTQYSVRRSQCYEAAKIMGQNSLRECGTEDLLRSRTKMHNDVFHRARHVITENIRTYDMAQAMKKGDLSSMGLLMVQSQNSLRDDLEVSSPIIDDLIEITMQAEGVYGSRLCGGGFRGCTVSLVQSGLLDSVISHIKKNYRGMANFYPVNACDANLDLKPILEEIKLEISS